MEEGLSDWYQSGTGGVCLKHVVVGGKNNIFICKLVLQRNKMSLTNIGEQGIIVITKGTVKTFQISSVGYRTSLFLKYFFVINLNIVF